MKDQTITTTHLINTISKKINIANEIHVPHLIRDATKFIERIANDNNEDVDASGTLIYQYSLKKAGLTAYQEKKYVLTISKNKKTERDNNIIKKYLKFTKIKDKLLTKITE